MIDRRDFLKTAALAALATPLVVRPRPASARSIPRVGVLGEVNPIGWNARMAAAEIECRWAGDRRERLRDLAAELVALDVDLLVAIGAAAARAAGTATKTVPIVFVAGRDQVDEDLARRRDNVTGLIVPSEAEIAEERLRVLRLVAPGLERVIALSNPDNPTGPRALEHGHAAADRQGADMSVVPARTTAEIEQALAAAPLGTGLLVMPDAMFAIEARRIATLASERRLPGVYPARCFVEAGGTVALHGDAAEVVRRTVALVARVLGGGAPGALPVRTCAPLALAVNLDAARAMGLALPRSLLARADRVAGAQGAPPRSPG